VVLHGLSNRIEVVTIRQPIVCWMLGNIIEPIKDQTTFVDPGKYLIHSQTPYAKEATGRDGIGSIAVSVANRKQGGQTLRYRSSQTRRNGQPRKRQVGEPPTDLDRRSRKRWLRIAAPSNAKPTA
jgi:hypothetical protein